jgi:hypothetical protein
MPSRFQLKGILRVVVASPHPLQGLVKSIAQHGSQAQEQVARNHVLRGQKLVTRYT